jgi:hypothetical protein
MTDRPTIASEAATKRREVFFRSNDLFFMWPRSVAVARWLNGGRCD